MRRPSTRTVVLVGLAVALLMAAVVSFYASGSPDGLEHVARRTGFIHTAEESASAGSPLAGYATRGVSSGRLSGGLAGVAGVAAVGALTVGLTWLLRRRQGRD